MEDIDLLKLGHFWDKWKDIYQKHGASGMGSYVGEQNFHNYRSWLTYLNTNFECMAIRIDGKHWSSTSFTTQKKSQNKQSIGKQNPRSSLPIAALFGTGIICSAELLMFTPNQVLKLMKATLWEFNIAIENGK